MLRTLAISALALAALSRPAAAEDVDHAERTRRAAIAGTTVGLAGYAMGTVSEVKMDNGLVSAGAGAAEFLTVGIGAPRVARTTRKARQATGVMGSPGMRLAGWTAYSAFMGHGVLLFTWGIVVTPGNTFIYPGQTQVNAAMGLAAASFFAGDAITTHHQILASGSDHGAAAAAPAGRTRKTTLSVAPSFRRGGAGLRLSGAF
jgi:hypothetical protein